MVNRLFGSYVAGDGPLHRADARVKLVGLAALSIALFTCDSLPVILAVLACLLVAACAEGVAPSAVARSVVPMAVVLVVALASNTLCDAASATIVLGGNVGLSADGFARGMLFAARIVALVAAALALCATTSVDALCDGLARFLHPLARLGFPADDVAMTVTLALRFIPTAQEELLRIRSAQAARGLLAAEKNVLSRLAGWGRAFVPLIVGLFVRAEQIAGAMRDRCYGTVPRAWQPKPLGARNWVALAATLAACALIGWM